MPRLAQPGGALQRMRVRYTAGCKLALLTMAKHLRDKKGISLCKSAERVQVSAGLLVKWEEGFSLGNDPIEVLLKTKKKSIHPSPLDQLKPLEEALLKYIFKKREQEIEISTLAIVVVASNLSTKFGEKNFVARCSAVKRFVKAHLLVYQMGTHLCQRLVVRVWLCWLVVGLVVRVVWAGCLCCEPLLYLLSCKAHKHKCTKKLATNGILGIAGKLLMRQIKLLHLIKADL
jgi:transcriptional regulator with XRE-family HTH domain